jgi:hypothetical protein
MVARGLGGKLIKRFISYGEPAPIACVMDSHGDFHWIVEKTHPAALKKNPHYYDDDDETPEQKERARRQREAAGMTENPNVITMPAVKTPPKVTGTRRPAVTMPKANPAGLSIALDKDAKPVGVCRSCGFEWIPTGFGKCSACGRRDRLLVDPSGSGDEGTLCMSCLCASGDGIKHADVCDPTQHAEDVKAAKLIIHTSVAREALAATWRHERGVE